MASYVISPSTHKHSSAVAAWLQAVLLCDLLWQGACTLITLGFLIAGYSAMSFLSLVQGGATHNFNKPGLTTA